MSISAQLKDLAENTAAIRAAIEAKSPAVPTGNGLASFPAAIKSIPNSGAWTKPFAWPDIRPILDADTHQYANKLIALLDADASMPSINLTGGTYYVLSDGYEGVGGNHVWNTSKDITGEDGAKYRWGIVMSDSELTNLAPCSGSSWDTKVLWSYGPGASVKYTGSYPNYRMTFCQHITVGTVVQTTGTRVFSDMHSLREIKADVIRVASMTQAFSTDENLVAIDVGTFDTSNCTDMYMAFNGCYSLKTIPSIDTSNVVNMSQAFLNCHNLVSIPNIDTSNVVNMSNAFNNCCNLISIPNLDTSAVTNMESIFNGCNSLQRLPESFVIKDGCVVNRIYQYCRNLHVPASRLVAGEGNGVIYYDAMSLESMGDYVDLRALTSYNVLLSGNSFVKTPTTLLLSFSLNISSSYYRAEYKDRFAEFDGNGNLIGGLVYNINTVSGLTLTVGSTMKGFFTADEQTAIVDAMSAKGWTLSW